MRKERGSELPWEESEQGRKKERKLGYILVLPSPFYYLKSQYFIALLYDDHLHGKGETGCVFVGGRLVKLVVSSIW